MPSYMASLMRNWLLSTELLLQGIEVAIKEAVPEIVTVADVTDHINGTNPFYGASKK